MTTIRLRPYQTEAIAAVRQSWKTGTQRAAVVHPTGTGKTVQFTALADQEVEAGSRPLILVHRDELLSQTIAKIKAMTTRSVGAVKAERNETGREITVASVQTLGRASRLDTFGRTDFDRVIVDEAHHAAADSYMRILTHFGCFLPETGHRAVGYSATLSRSDDRKLSSVWEKVVHALDVLPAILSGYLVDVRGRRVTVSDLDLGNVTRTGGDYSDGSMGKEMIRAHTGEVIVKAYSEHGRRADGSFRPAICFAPSVEAAYAFARDLNGADGITAEVVVGETPLEDRAGIYARVKAGATNVLVSCMVLTEGFDLPEAEVAILARPTSNVALYVQMVGRVLRPAPWNGKTSALVLDVTGSETRHRLATLADLSPGQVVDLEDDEGLVDGAQRTSKRKPGPTEPGPVEPGQVTTIDTEDFNLFHSSASVWLKTHAGVWFIPAKDRLFFLWPSAETEGAWRVGSCSNHSVKGGVWLQDSLPIDMAMMWAESYAGEADQALFGMSLTSRSASWRARKSKPSDAQLGLAARLRIPGAEEMTKAQLSDAISIVFASRVLDRHASR